VPKAELDGTTQRHFPVRVSDRDSGPGVEARSRGGKIAGFSGLKKFLGGFTGPSDKELLRCGKLVKRMLAVLQQVRLVFHVANPGIPLAFAKSWRVRRPRRCVLDP
jgi:hypothetical protein